MMGGETRPLNIIFEVKNMVDAYEQQRVLHSPFDVETHKKTFINYLEVIIHPDGTIEYAVPSHMIKLTEIYGKTSEEMFEDYYASGNVGAILDPVEWICKQTGCISVWTDGYAGHANAVQKRALLMLKNNEVYGGRI